MQLRKGLTDSSGTFVKFFVFTAGCKALDRLDPPCTPPGTPGIFSRVKGQGVSMTFNAASRLRSLEDRSAWGQVAALPGMHSVPKSAVLPYASGVGGLSRRLLIILYYIILYYIILYYIILYYIILCYVMLYYIILYYIILYYIISYYNILCYVMLCYII